jgi:hypothetical protein
MTTKTEQLDALFQEWRGRQGEQAAGFAPDGIIEEPAWDAAPRKVLFLAKEPNEYSDDLRVLWRRKPWKTLGRWAYGLQNVQESRIPHFVEATQDYRNAFAACAIVNLKKSPGGSSADPQEIQKALESNCDFVLREMEIIRPDIVVCCGTFDSVQKCLLPLPQVVEANAEGWYIFQSMVLIKYCHPSAPYSESMMYYGLVGAYHAFLARQGDS